ncbi:large-conductance mechanosensitive channel [Syncephalis fuscata]|nr:large-conductance mechanosensitive channel [Syncephalis fuscata]
MERRRGTSSKRPIDNDRNHYEVDPPTRTKSPLIREHLLAAGSTVQHAGEEVIQQTRSLWQEFIEFIDQGNVVELAIGVIIAGVFTKVVDSLVNDVLLPPLGLFTGSNLSNNFIIIRKPDSPPSSSSPSLPVLNTVIQQGNTQIIVTTNVSGSQQQQQQQQQQLLHVLLSIFNNTGNLTNALEFNTPDQAQEAGAVTLNYGRFLQTILNFFLISFCLYLFIRVFQLFQREAIYNKLIKCRYCKRSICKSAVRCPLCTSFLDGREDQRVERWPPRINSWPPANEPDTITHQLDAHRPAIMEPISVSDQPAWLYSLNQSSQGGRDGGSAHQQSMPALATTVGRKAPTSITPLLSTS